MKKTAQASAQVYAVLGSDESEVKRAAAELAAKLTPPDAGDFGLEIIDGCGDNAEQSAARVRLAIEAIQTLPFFGGKLVWLKNANCLGDSVIGRSAAAQAALEELGDVLEAGLAPDITFLLSATEIDKRRSFYKALSKRAELEIIDKLDASRSGWEEEATEIVRGRVGHAGCSSTKRRSICLCCSPVATRARSRTSWRSSISTRLRIGRSPRRRCGRSCLSRARV
jgi:DNA polymerase-3 subunit delta